MFLREVHKWHLKLLIAQLYFLFQVYVLNVLKKDSHWRFFAIKLNIVAYTVLDWFSDLVSFFIVSKDYLIVFLGIGKDREEKFLVWDKIVNWTDDFIWNLWLLENVVEFWIV